MVETGYTMDCLLEETLLRISERVIANVENSPTENVIKVSSVTRFLNVILKLPLT